MRRKALRVAAIPAEPPPITTTSTSLSGIALIHSRPQQLIIHPHQIKPLRGRNLAASGAVAGGKRCGESSALHLPSPTWTSEPTIERT